MCAPQQHRCAVVPRGLQTFVLEHVLQACCMLLAVSGRRQSRRAKAAAQHVTALVPVAGIGGVHRGGESSMDVSSDLTELGRTPVAVVCAGAKSVLDIPRTLEYLETQVPCPPGHRPARLLDAQPAHLEPGAAARRQARVR